MTQKPFRFSLVSHGTETAEAWITKAKRAEELGYTTFLMPDHFADPIDPVTGLQIVAEHTSLRIGSHVFCNDFRHPLVLARQVANLDLFSQGRFQLGIGCGYLASEYQQAGITLDPNGVRISRFEEAVQILKASFQQEEVSFAGKYYTVSGMKTGAKTYQKPHPPLYIGGGGKRTLSFAAREADIVGLAARNTASGLDWSSSLPEATDEKLTWIKAAAGERFEHLELSATIFICAVTPNRVGAAQGIGQKLGLSAEQALSSTHVLIGSVEQIIQDLYERRERFGISCIEVAGQNMEAFAPVVSALTGR